MSEPHEIVRLEGEYSVLAALEARSRPIERVVLAQGKFRPAAARAERLAREGGIQLEVLPRHAVDALAAGGTHGGMLAFAGARTMHPPDALLEAALAARANPCLAYFDGIEDPYNLGQAIRACYAAGIDGVICPPRAWGEAETALVRASAGTYERMPLAAVPDLERAAAACHAYGLAVIVTDSDDAQPYDGYDLTQPALLVIGGERRGVTRAFARAADARLRIPYGRAFDGDLGAVAATAVLAFEVARQRRAREGK
jgi:23S rRNA (guanosine2251-2'-O)-methyltransferase